MINKSVQLIDRSAAFSFDAVRTTTYADDYISRGKGFQVVRTIEIDTETTVKFAADFSVVDSDKIIFILPVVMASSDSPVHVKTYGITTYTGGTAYPPINLNLIPPVTVAQGVLKHSVTSSDTPGDSLREYEIGSAGNPVTTRGGTTEGASPLIAPSGSIFILEAENYSATNATFFNLVITWYEI